MVPEAEPVEAVGIENVDNLPSPEAEPVDAVGTKEGYFGSGVGYFRTYPLEFITSITPLKTGVGYLKLTSLNLLTRISRFRTPNFHLKPENFDQKLTRNRVNIGK